MKIDDLLIELGSMTTTMYQKNERLKAVVGQRIEITDWVEDIHSDGMMLKRWGHLSGGHHVQISFDKRKCGDEFLMYSKGDEIKLIATLESVSFIGTRSLRLDLDCVSVVRVRTIESLVQEVEAQRASKLEADRKAKDSSCFVATVVFEESDSESLVTLRRYRDEELRTIMFGRLAISIYELIGPVLARGILQAPRIRKTIRRVVVLPASRFAEGRLRQRSSL